MHAHTTPLAETMINSGLRHMCERVSVRNTMRSGQWNYICEHKHAKPVCACVLLVTVITIGSFAALCYLGLGTSITPQLVHHPQPPVTLGLFVPLF